MNPTQKKPEAEPDPFLPFKDELKKLIYDKIRLPVDFARQTQLLLALRNELFWRAKQYLTFGAVDNNGLTIQPVAGIPGAPSGKKNEPQALSYVFNITRGDGQKFVSVVGARVPYVTVTARNGQDPQSIKQARDTRAIAIYLDDIWDAENAQKDLARTLFRSGPQFGHVCWVTDKKYGEVEVQQAELQEVNEDGTSYQRAVPSGEPQKISRGMPELHAKTIFEVTVPQGLKKIDTNTPWLDCTELEPIGSMKDLYGDEVAGVSGETPSGDDSSSQATAGQAYDLITAAGNSRQERTDKWWHRRTWLHRKMYSYASEGLQAVLNEHAPDGIRVVFIQEEYIKAVPEKLVDHWVVCKTGTDDQILGDPLCHDLIPFQQIINDFFGLAIETMMRAIPRTIIDPTMMDRKAIEDNPANVAEIIFSKPMLGKTLGSMMAEMPVAKFSEQMMPLYATLREVSQELDGVQKVIFGGGEPAPTWRQDQQRKNQALAQFFITWDEMRSYRRGAMQLAMNLIAKLGMGSIEVPSDDSFSFGPNLIDLQGFDPTLVDIDTEESMPRSRAEEADELTEQLSYPPPLQAALGIFDPINVSKIVELKGIRGVTSTSGLLRERTLQTIGELIQGQPQPQTGPDGMPAMGPDGQPVLNPSIAPDPFAFKNATFAVEIVRAFVNSDTGMALSKTNPAGFKNAHLFGEALDKMATPPPPPAPPVNKSFSVAVSPQNMPPNQFAAILDDFDIKIPPPVGAPLMPLSGPGSPPAGGGPPAPGAAPAPPAPDENHVGV